MVIISYADRVTKDLAAGRSPAEFKSFERVAKRKLVQLDAAVSLTDLASPPGNRLEHLKGNREGQWRICFLWTDQGPAEVEIVDYH